MNPYLAVAALIGVVSVMLMLPIIPAMVELQRKSDATPLHVVPQNAGEIRHFADGFRTYLRALQPTLQQCMASGTAATGTMPDGAAYFVVGGANETPWFLLRQNSVCPFVIAAGGDLTVPDETTFANDVYSGGSFVGGEKNYYRALLGEKNVQLGPCSRVMRWAHAVGDFHASAGCQLYGRVSSDSVLRLDRNCSFLRLNAPRIVTGRAENGNFAPPDSNFSAEAFPIAPQRFLYDGDFVIGAGEVIRGNLVVRGKLRIAAGAKVCGSVKSGKDMVLETGVCVEGSLISGRKMRVGSACSVRGPVIAEREMFIAAGTQCGSLQNPTTASSPRIVVEEGVTVFGTLWARESGQVVGKG